MELRNLIRAIKNSAYLLLLSGFVCGFVGIIAYFLLPKTYIATGSFYVKRQAEEVGKDYFTYEGYYAQQTALSYTNTIMGFFESADVRKKALESLGISSNERELRRFNRDIKIKKLAPQLVLLSVKAQSASQAGSLWTSLAKSALSIAAELNKNGDEKLTVTSTAAFPVVQETYSNVYLNFIIGFLLGCTLYFSAIALKEYYDIK